MSDDTPSDSSEDATEANTDEMPIPGIVPDEPGEVYVSEESNALTRDWPAPANDGPSLMNPLVESDFNEVFTTTVEQPFPTETDTSSKSEAGPGDTAEDPIPTG